MKPSPWPMLAVVFVLTPFAAAQPRADTVRLRVATFNVEDLRSEDLDGSGSDRARRLAEIIQRVRPNILLINEIAYDPPTSGEPGGRNGQRFADALLATPQADGCAALRMRAFMAPVNTGVPSGLDLDNDGVVTTRLPEQDGSGAAAYAGDCWGYGTFPGQYGMALLVDERLVIEGERARTFRLYPWDYLPGALLPENEDKSPWFDEKERSVVRLSSKSHWDVPVRLPNGRSLRVLCSHPTPPVFDGVEKRNARRNRDEIRFWAEYVDNAGFIVDDKGVEGGLPRWSPFVILGDLNADPDEGDAWKNPIENVLGTATDVNLDVTPRGAAAPGLDDDDTARFGLRVDYVIPSRIITVIESGIWREPPARGAYPSDHFLVWMDVELGAE